jgi:peroxiredoxin-like protein
MASEPYFYKTEIAWKLGRRGELRSLGLPPLAISTPPEFKGESGFWTPEHLFVAAAEACLMATFIAIAENSGLPIVSYRSTASGRLERVENAGLRFTEILIVPEVQVEHPEDETRAARIMGKAEKGCLIANSIAANLRVEARFFAGALQAA